MARSLTSSGNSKVETQRSVPKDRQPASVCGRRNTLKSARKTAQPAALPACETADPRVTRCAKAIAAQVVDPAGGGTLRKGGAVAVNPVEVRTAV